MITNPAQITRHHLANQVAPAFSLIRKVCACGKASTTKQLAQHGKCAACALAAVRDAIMPGDFAKLQHMLGAVKQYPKNKWGWRNYFAAGSGQQHEAMQRLVVAGPATAGRAATEMSYFHAIRQAVGSLSQIAARFGTSATNVAVIKKRTSWAHLPEVSP